MEKDLKKEGIEKVAADIVDASIKVHKQLGPGLLESAYQRCLMFELNNRGHHVECEVSLPILYDGHHIDAGYRIDLWVDRLIVIENKVVEQVLPIHRAQLITYLKLTGCQIGFLLNWNVRLMKNGIERMVYHFQETP